jgi:RNA recognition motif-containing protein
MKIIMSLLRCKMLAMSMRSASAAFMSPSPLSSFRATTILRRHMMTTFHNSNSDNNSLIKDNQKSSPSSLQMSTSSSSWMDKNEEFVSHDGQASPSTPPRSNRKTEKQRRRRNNNRREEFNERVIDRPQQNFRDNFRGTRVFVQGLPDWVNWQELKDHFKIAGDVVFASVSINTATGTSKGCGVVQFESTEMAQNAIKIMRNHPLEDGSVLYVRQDHQEENNSKSLSPNNGNRRGSTAPLSQWRCADEDNSVVLSADDASMVKNLIKARDQARKRRNYETSDNIRKDLKIKFDVHLDDRLKLWWVSADNSVPSSVTEVKGDGRWGKRTQEPWRQIPTTRENDACVSADLVNGLLQQRDIARREKDFNTADRLLDEARDSPDGDLYLRIHDESRTWRIWTPEKPLGPVRHKLSPSEQCIALVKKHDPSKIDEVKNLLEKFPGREWNILKRLQQNYDSIE